MVRGFWLSYSDFAHVQFIVETGPLLWRTFINAHLHLLADAFVAVVHVEMVVVFRM